MVKWDGDTTKNWLFSKQKEARVTYGVADNRKRSL